MDTLELYKKALELQNAGRRFALASVVHASGSTPQKAGANALFEAAGAVWGTLGGGCMEAESRRRALQSLDVETPLLFDLKLDEVKGWDDGLICGGKVRILVQPNPAKLAEAHAKAVAALALRKRGVLVTVLRHPDFPMGHTLWIPEGEIHSNAVTPAHGELAGILEGNHAQTLCAADDVELFIEPIAPPLALLIAGAGHIGKALARQASLLGFEVTVVDDRETFANADNIPWAKQTICGDIAETVGGMPFDPQSYLVIVTRGHRHDGAVLAACIRKPAAFIGMIGSKRKSLLIRQSLREEGLATEAELARVVSPVGLDIGAESVEEIALSIAAQLVAVRRKRSLSGDTMNYAP